MIVLDKSIAVKSIECKKVISTTATIICGMVCMVVCIYLGTTNDGGEGAFGHIYGALEVVQFLLQEETSHRGLEKCSHTCQERVRALM